MFQSIERPAKEFKAFLPSGYRKRKVYIHAAENITLHDLNWSGGTRNQYAVFTVDGQAGPTTAKYNQLAPWANPAEGARLPIPEGFVVVKSGHFCGREATARIHVHPANMPRLLPAIHS